MTTTNIFEWQDYVNATLDELVEFKRRRESDLTMENLRLQRLLDASIQRIGETEEECRRLRELLSDIPGIEEAAAGPGQSSTYVGTSE